MIICRRGKTINSTRRLIPLFLSSTNVFSATKVVGGIEINISGIAFVRPTYCVFLSGREKSKKFFSSSSVVPSPAIAYTFLSQPEHDTITTTINSSMPPLLVPRRSARIRALSGLSAASEAENEDDDGNYEPPLEELPTTNTMKRKLRSSTSESGETSSKSKSSEDDKKPAKKKKGRSKGRETIAKPATTTARNNNGIKKKETTKICLPRTRELQLLGKKASSSIDDNGDNTVLKYEYVMGIDEAGRGPLAGPVVAAAIVCPTDIPGIIDSKKITKEKDREELYETIVSTPGVQWAVAVIDAPRIDEINILQATLEGMRLCATALVNRNKNCSPHFSNNNNDIVKSDSDDDADGKSMLRFVDKASIEETGCYVVTNSRCRSSTNPSTTSKESSSSPTKISSSCCFALIDGNKVPDSMPCEAESIIKGDSKEYTIAAASILAKVTRDRLMHQYHQLYPQYNFAMHKGYPTSEHMAIVMKNGPTPIHRRSFAPLKHMEFDDD